MTTPSTGPGEQHPGSEDRRMRRLRTTAAVAISTTAVLVAALAIVLLRGDEAPGPAGTPPGSASPAPTLTTSPTPSTPKPTTSTPKQSPTPTTSTPVAFKYQPLWPFTSMAAAQAWQEAYRASGQQPWHLDAGRTALAFTTGYLGFTEIDRVVSRSVRGSEAWVAVGYRDPNGEYGVAAVLHLARIGSGHDAPWEVVGSRDTTLSIDRPSYGAKVSSPVTVGGRITGVDESIVVEVRQPSTERPIGSTPGVPAGGQNQPWSTRVSIRGATDPALTIVAFTGGHLQRVERFAITGVRN
ncbi:MULTISPECIES: hypothetical protein [unclassified Kribbella]|uniref:hypothetical protein n=1 Tax=unclassified Kribbella TaxID=2644121 RepID=UPI003016FD4F